MKAIFGEEYYVSDVSKEEGIKEARLRECVGHRNGKPLFGTGWTTDGFFYKYFVPKKDPTP